jgi:hypothetical protein
VRGLATSTLLSSALLLAACRRCERDPQQFEAGAVEVQFDMRVSPDEARARLQSSGFSDASVRRDHGQALARVHVEPGEECAAEAKLKGIAGVVEAYQPKRY